KPLPDDLFPKIDFFTPNETETQFYTGLNPGRDLRSARQAADLLLAKGVAHVVITLGGRGAFYASGGIYKLYPAFPITPVDTTAAGDAFNGGLAVMLAEGKSIPEAIRFANAAGAVCAMRAGAQSAIGSRQEIEMLIQSHPEEKYLRGNDCTC
ncbi:MAG TPA: ribokinase, partial [Clostridiales bacterium]|nr:ribokinase [Clostridiales bacterium]